MGVSRSIRDPQNGWSPLSLRASQDVYCLLGLLWRAKPKMVVLMVVKLVNYGE